MLDQFPKAIALFTGILVGFSVLHDWAYFKWIDFSYFHFMTVADHLTVALERVPFILLVALIVMILGLRRQIVRGHREPFQPRSIDYPIFEFGNFVVYASPDPWKHIFIGLVFLYIPSLLIFPGDGAIYFSYVMFFVIWERLLSPVAKWMWEQKINSLVPILHFGVLLIAFALGGGVANALSDLNSENDQHVILTKSEKSYIGIRILRNSQKGILVFDSFNKKISFVPWPLVDEVNSIRVYDKRSVICRWFNICFMDNLGDDSKV